MPDRPILFLDVDGVLNCLGATVPTTCLHGGTGYQAFVPEGTRERLARLIEAFEPVWATAWLGGAHGPFRKHLQLSEIPWPYITYADLKLPEIMRFASGRPWVWVDDDAKWELEELGWSERHLDGDVCRIVVPDAREGLTDQHVDDLLGWAAALGDKEPS